MKRIGSLRCLLRLASPVLLLAAILVWLATGANRGWTKTSVPAKRTDEVTGLSVDEYHKQFVPGVDFLGAALLFCLSLTAVSFFLPRKPEAICYPPKPNHKYR